MDLRAELETLATLRDERERANALYEEQRQRVAKELTALSHKGTLTAGGYTVGLSYPKPSPYFVEGFEEWVRENAPSEIETVPATQRIRPSYLKAITDALASDRDIPDHLAETVQFVGWQPAKEPYLRMEAAPEGPTNA